MIIDSHAHVILPTEKQLAAMAEAEVDRTVLFVTTPHPELAADGDAFAAEHQKLLRVLAGERSLEEQRRRLVAVTAELATAVAAHPRRLLGFGTAPLGLTADQTAQWVETRVVPYRLRGLGEFTPKPGEMDLLEPVFAAAADCGNLPVWVHTFFPCGPEDIRALLIIARRHPSVPLIAGHLGGYHWLPLLEAARDTANVYLDLSAAFSVFPPKFAMKELPERTLFASDAPYGDPWWRGGWSNG